LEIAQLQGNFTAMPPREVDSITITEWRELGYFYDFDPNSNSWIIRGSRNGIQKLIDQLKAFAKNPKFAEKSEHEHFGPYMYLKVMTWDFPDITNKHGWVPKKIFCVWPTFWSQNSKM
jgi:hypothetical protein